MQTVVSGPSRTLDIWAPTAASVHLVLGDHRLPMRQGRQGWWTATAPARPGDDYGLSIDGGAALPDPRSRWQPHGVHGRSRLVDDHAFRWTDAGWQAPPFASGVVYELHVGTFSAEGTFDGAIRHLAHLVELGITHVELMPVAQFAGTHGWGYDGVDLFAPHAAYGGPDGLKRLVDACHARGLAVLIDVVYNHLGPSGNYLGRFGPYFTERHRTPWGDAVNLDGPGSDEVRRFFCDNALMWLSDYHADGLRLDAVHALIDTSAVHFLEQLATEVDRLEGRLGRHLVLVAESDLNDPRLLRPREIGGYGIDAQWSDDFHHALHVALTGERIGYYEDFGGLADLALTLEREWIYDGRFSRHRGRRHGRPADGVPRDRFVHCLQNHDQIGNRARGERSAALMSAGRLKIAAAFVLLGTGVPMLFQGEEWAASTPFQYFTDHEDAELGRAVSEGRRREFVSFGWAPEDVPDPQDLATLERSRLNWAERLHAPHAEVLDWHRRLIAVRRRVAASGSAAADTVRARVDEKSGWLVYERDELTVACNIAGGAQRVALDPARPTHVLLASDPDVRVTGGSIELPPDAVALLGA